MIKNIIIPMAGLGKRFVKENFSTIKPLIQIDKKCIFEESINELPDSKNKIVILNSRVFNKYEILQNILKKKNINHLLLETETLGQSDTCYKAKKIINQNEDLLIHSCDYVMKYSYKKLKQVIAKNDVIIFTYRLKSTIVQNYEDYAYCKEENGKVIRIVEKKVISKNPKNDPMIIGTFWFKKSSDFFLSHELSVKNKKFINNELYIANNINSLLKNKKVKIFEVDYWKNLGDYFSYNQYIYWKNFFKK